MQYLPIKNDCKKGSVYIFYSSHDSCIFNLWTNSGTRSVFNTRSTSKKTGYTHFKHRDFKN